MSKNDRSSGGKSRKSEPSKSGAQELSDDVLDRVVGGVGEVRRPEEDALDAAMIAAAEAAIEQQAAFASFRDDRDATEVAQQLSQAVTSGRLENVAGDVNYFAVQLQSGLSYNFNTQGSGFNAALVLYDANGRAVSVDDNGAGGTQAKIDFKVPEGGSGTYYLGIAVSGGGQSTAEFRINTSALNEQNQAVNLAVALDPTSFSVSAAEDVLGQRGNAYAGFGADQFTLQVAPQITGSLTTGVLDPQKGDANYHQLQLREGVTYTIDTKSSALGNTVLALFDAKGNAIQVDDDGGGAGKSSLTFTVPVGQEGRYYVGVSSFGGQETGGSYRLNLAANVQGTAVDVGLALNPDSLLVARDSDLARGIYAGFAADQNTFQLSPALTAAVTTGALDRERGDANYHTLQLRAGVTYTFDTSGSAIRDAVLALFDGRGQAIVVGDSARGLLSGSASNESGAASRVTFTVPAGGDGKYYLGISSAAGLETGGNYRINVAAAVQGTPVEAGLSLNPQAVLIQSHASLQQWDYTNFGADQNTLQRAPAITTSQTDGVLDRERGDANYHTLQLRAGVTYTFDTIGSKNADPVIALFDAKGKVLVMDDQSAGNNQARVSFTVPEGGDGTYYFGVSSWGQYAGEGTSYRVNIAAKVGAQAVDTALALDPAAGLMVQRDADLVATAFAGFAADQSTLQAAPRISAAITTGNLEATRGDANYHLLQLREGVTYTVDTRGSGVPNTVLALFDAKGNAIRVDDDSAGAGKSLLTFTVPPGGAGTYYVGVSSFGGADIGGSYRINVAAALQGNALDIALALNPAAGVLIQRDRDIDTPAYIAFQQDHGSQEAAPFITAAAVGGKLDGAGDASYHSVRLLAGHEYRFSASGITPALVLFDAEGNAIRADVTGEGHNAQLVFKVPADGAGLYRIGVAVAGGGAGAATYTLNTVVRDPQDRPMDAQTALELAAQPAAVAERAPASAAPDVNDGDSVRIQAANIPALPAYAAFVRDAGSVQVAAPMLGGSVSARFDAGSLGTNYHSVTLREGWSYDFSPQAAATVALFDPQGRMVATAGATGLHFKVPEGDAGTYYLGVAGASGEYRIDLSVSRGGEVGPESLRIQPDPSLRAFDYAHLGRDENTQQVAPQITGATTFGTLDREYGDANYHRVYFKEGVTYTIDTVGSQMGDSVLALFDANGKVLALDDQGAGVYNQAKMSFTVPKGGEGTYYLGIASWSEYSGAGEGYRLNIAAASGGSAIDVVQAIRAPIVDAAAALDLTRFFVEPGETLRANPAFAAFVADAGEMQKAVPLASSEATGRLITAGEAQYRAVQLVPGLTYEFNTAGSAADTVLALFDGSGRAIVSSDDGAGLGQSARVTFRVPEGGGGVYYLGIAAEPGAAAGAEFKLNTVVVDAVGQRVAAEDALALGTLVFDDTLGMRGLNSLDIPERELNDARQFVVARDTDINGDAGLYRAFSFDQGERVTATPLVGAGVAGKLGAEAGDANYHSVRLLPGLTYTFHSGGSAFNTVLALFNEKGEAVQVNNDYYGIQDKSLIRFTVPSDGAGVYYVGVAAASGIAVADGSYQLRAMAHVSATTAAQATQFSTLTESGSTNRAIVANDKNVRAAASDQALDASLALSPNGLRVQADPDLAGPRYANFAADASGNRLQLADRITGASLPGTVELNDVTDYRSVELLPGVTYTFKAADLAGRQPLAAVLMDEQGRTLVTDTVTTPGALRFTVPEGGGGSYFLGVGRVGPGASTAVSYDLQMTAAVARTGEALDLAQTLLLGAQTYSDYVGASSGGAGGSLARDENDVDSFRVAADVDISGALYAGFRDDQTSVQAATPMLGGTVRGQLDNQQGDANYHSVRLLPGVTYTFDTRGSSFDTVLALFDGSGRAIAVDDNAGARSVVGAAGASLLRFTVPSDGEGVYYLGVSSAGGATAGAGYQLNLTAVERAAGGAQTTVDAASALDPNRFVVQNIGSDGRASVLLAEAAFQAFLEDQRTVQSAAPMTGAMVNGKLDATVRDANYHAIELLPGVTYSFDTRGSGIADPVLALFDHNGRPLASNDDGLALGQNSRILFTVPMDGGGTYYLGVAADPTARAATAPAGLEYRLYSSVVPSEDAAGSVFVPQDNAALAAGAFANFRADLGNRQAAADVVAPVVSGKLDGLKEGVDYLAIELRAGLTYTLDTVGSSFNTTLALFDSQGRVLQASDNVAGLGDKSRVSFTVPAGADGTYYIGVSTAGANQPGGDYKLNVTAVNERGGAVSAAAALDPNNVLIQFDADIAGGLYAGFRDDQGTLQAAPALTESRVTGVLENVRGDANYHTLSLRAGFTYTIDTAGSGFNTVLALFDADGRAIRVNDDGGGTLGQASRITFTVPADAAGDYAIGISSANGTQVGGSYVLNVAAQDAAGRSVDARLALDPAMAAGERALQFATLFQDDMPSAPQAYVASGGVEVGVSLLAGFTGQVTAGAASFSFGASVGMSATAEASGSVTVTANSITVVGSAGVRVELTVGAGGEIDVGPLKAAGAVELKLVAEAMVAGSAYFGPHGFAVAAKAYAGVSAELSARFSVSLSENFAVEGTATGTAFMYAVAEAKAAISDKGIEAALGAEVGVGMGGSVKGSYTIGGVTVGGEIGASIGFQAGFSVSGHATYEDGVISLGLDGAISLLLGIDLSFNIDIDIGALIDFGEDVADFFSNDVADFFEEDVADFFTEDVADFFVDLGGEIVDAFEEVGDAFESFADSFVDWITKPC